MAIYAVIPDRVFERRGSFSSLGIYSQQVKESVHIQEASWKGK